MKKLLFTLWSVLLLAFAGMAQENPVKWNCSVEYGSGNEAVLVMKAEVGGGFHLYSQFMEEGGPMPTVFNFPQSADYKVSGKPSESPKPIQETDEIFGTMVQFFAKDAEFRQKITINTEKDFEIAATVDYQVCNDTTCLPFGDIELKFKVKGVKQAAVAEVAAEMPEAGVVESESGENNIEAMEEELLSASASAASNTNSRPLGILLVMALIWGFVAVFTPCVFPMIPMTITIFMDTEEGASRKAGMIKGLIFMLSIALIYTVIGAVVSLGAGLSGAEAVTNVAAHWITNLIFFALFVTFALSFFGLFEITLPTGLSNKMDAKADMGGYISAFFMAAVLTIVSFSCTGPFFVTLLTESLEYGVFGPILAMFFFGLAMGLPFFILSLFPALVAKLPKSGGWLNSIKVVFAFLLLALSVKYLSVVDQAWAVAVQKPFVFLPRDLAIGIWIVLFVMMGLYLMGKIKFSHDSDVPHLGVFRFILVCVCFVFALYLLPGIFGAPLKSVAPLLPPAHTQQVDFTVSAAPAAAAPATTLCGTPKYADNPTLSLPKGYEGYFDYEEGLACAKQQNKPVFLDFKGHGCANCKAMENSVWSLPEVQQMMQNFVIIALYCDDKTPLAENECYTSKVNGKEIKTLGAKNKDIEMAKFNTFAQPFYYIVDPDGNPVADQGIGKCSAADFTAYLQKALDAFKK